MESLQGVPPPKAESVARQIVRKVASKIPARRRITSSHNTPLAVVAVDSQPPTEGEKKKLLYPSLQDAFQARYDRSLPIAEGEEGIEGAKFINANGDTLQLFTSKLQDEDASVRVIRVQNNSSTFSTPSVEDATELYRYEKYTFLHDDMFVEDLITGRTFSVSSALAPNALLYFFPRRQLETRFGREISNEFRTISVEEVNRRIGREKLRVGLRDKQLAIFGDIETVDDLARLLHELGHTLDTYGRNSTLHHSLRTLQPWDRYRLEQQGVSIADINNEETRKERNAGAISYKIARRLMDEGFRGIPQFHSRVLAVNNRSLEMYEAKRIPSYFDDSVDMDRFTTPSRRARIATRQRIQGETSS